MEVILLKDIDNLGKEGKVVKVKEGFARNYLIPKGLALKSVKENQKKLEEIKRDRAKTIERLKNKYSEIKAKLEALSLTITAEVKEDDDIYGSITETQILKHLENENIKLDKGMIILNEPIKKIGVYNIVVKLHSEIDANLRVWIVKK